jgi:hypothetical protein
MVKRSDPVGLQGSVRIPTHLTFVVASSGVLAEKTGPGKLSCEFWAVVKGMAAKNDREMVIQPTKMGI